MLVLVVVCEGTIRCNRMTFTGYNALSWAFTREQVAAGALQADVLCLGDSRIKYAVLPQVVRATTGRTAYNLAITAGRPAASYFLLRDALDAGARPRAIVVDFDEKLLADDPVMPSAPPPWSDLLTRREAVELERTVGAPSFAARVALEHLLHSLKNRYEIRTMVSRVVRGKGLSSRAFHEVAWRNWTVARGAQVNQKRVFKVPPPPIPPGRHVEGTWEPNPLNVRYVERFLALAEERSIPVFWVLPPRCPTVQTWREWYGEEWRYEQFTARMLERFSGVVVIDARHSNYDAGVFVDVVHLDRDGASALSHDLAVAMEAITSLPRKPRWAQLPAYREPPAVAGLEDFRESALALGIGEKVGPAKEVAERGAEAGRAPQAASGTQLGERPRVIR